MSNHYTSGEGEAIHNTAASRREQRASNATGALPPLQSIQFERHPTHGFDFEQMLQSLHDLFEHDRHLASQPDATRCGLCYLHFHVHELVYRDEGFYVCANCSQNLGHHAVPMVRKQQKL